ncbi:MAG TPA: hypothetical protein VLK59_14750 [Solirubrobacteraceae bacterium]|nr:hypothetical protein [Solirubrobacteraceae bacterium]
MGHDHHDRLLVIGVVVVGAGTCTVRIGVISVYDSVREWLLRRRVLRDG